MCDYLASTMVITQGYSISVRLKGPKAQRGGGRGKALLFADLGARRVSTTPWSISVRVRLLTGK
jgi:hypothetical protein